MIKEQFKRQVEGCLAYLPTSQQEKLVELVYDFLLEEESVFLLKGYAGTGKSSMIAAIIRALKMNSWNVVLLAPTGRAARVFADFASLTTSTIHRKIYKQDSGSSGTSYMPTRNLHTHTIFVVDEASMISNQINEFNQSSLLRDLIEYVFEGEDCRLILVGDTAQLPPIGQTFSYALDEDTLSGYGLRVFQTQLTDVLRQESESGILRIATMLRDRIDRNDCSELPLLEVDSKDVCVVSDYDIQDRLESSMSDCQTETLVITRSNWSANMYNQQVRFRILGKEEEISNGDRVVIVKNNYKWLTEYLNDEGYEHLNKMSFIANGETARVVRARSIITKYGCRFVDVTLWLEDQKVEIEANLFLNVLYAQSPSMRKEDMQSLWDRIIREEELELTKTGFAQEFRQNPYLNALQVKYAYAMTCHKAQGGEWNDVFIDMSAIRKDMIGLEFYRWLYTAITRTRRRLFLINPPEEMISQKR